MSVRATRFQTNGLEWDADAQAAHAGARDYYPTFGSWNAPDPYDGSYDPYDPQSFNRYAYVGNSPVSFNDPSGLARWNNISAEEGHAGLPLGCSSDSSAAEAGTPGKPGKRRLVIHNKSGVDLIDGFEYSCDLKILCSSGNLLVRRFPFGLRVADRCYFYNDEVYKKLAQAEWPHSASFRNVSE